MFLQLTQDCFLNQHVMHPTRKESILDLILSSEEEIVDNIEVQEHFGNSDHNSITWDTIIRMGQDTTKRYAYRDWKRAHWEKMKEELSNMQWEQEMKGRTVEDMWKILKEKYEKQIDEHVPMREHKNKKKPMWQTKKVIKHIRKKRKAWNKWKECGTKEREDNYKKEQRLVKLELENAKRDFERKMAEKIKDDPKTFYSYIRSKQRAKDEVGPIKDENGNVIDTEKETVEALNKCFHKVFTKENDNIPEIHMPENARNTTKLMHVNITEEMVLKKLMEIKQGKAAGPDNISTYYLKNMALQLARPLQILYQKSLDSSTIPDDWKKSNITPLYKKGARSDVGNYRPVNLTSVPGKIMEKILKDEIATFLETHNIIADTQHGFQRGKSCTSNLILYWDMLTKYVDSGIPVDVIYLDLSKAFDTVPHKRLIAKIKAHGIEGDILNWIEEWLRNRKQRVVLNGEVSEWMDVTSSVVQGSVLGPLCFTIYMNDMEEGITSTLSKFADDTKVIHPMKTPADQEILQNDINKLLKWAEDWQMAFNISKCAVIHFGNKNPKYAYHMGEMELKQSKEEKDLGVYITENMKFSKHCAEAVKKANKVIGMIKRNFINFDKEVMMMLYKSLIRPHIDYCVPVWRPYLQKDVKLVEGVQRRMTKLIPKLRNKTYEQRLKALNLITMEKRHLREDMITLYNITQGKIKIDITDIREFVDTTNTRGNTVLRK